FLLPGFTDAHVHFFQTGGLYTRPDAIDLRKHMPFDKEIEWAHVNMIDALKRYVQNGITSVIDVGATNNFLQLRNKFKDKSYAPAVYMTGPLLTSQEPAPFKKLGNDEPFSLVTNTEEAKKMVQEELAFHPDFIKIWYIIDQADKEGSARKYQPVVKAIIEEAHKNNLKVAVHATERITAQLAIESGCDFLVHSVDDEIVSDDFIKLIKSKHIILCPTLVVFDGYGKSFGQQLDFSLNELRHANPQQLGSLYDLKHLPEKGMIDSYKQAIRNNKPKYDRQDSVSYVNLKKMVDAGVRIAAGTDAGNIGTLHATSFLNELNKMKKSGISNWQILQAATINPSYILNKEKQTGSIAVGKTADMLLLSANPVDSLQNLEKIELVINKGFIIRPDTLIKETALSLVQRQLNAYNARNLDAFLEPYAEDVELYDFPSRLLCKGKEEMRKQYAFFKNVPELHCEIKERILQGNTIIDKESVTGVGTKAVEATAIYQIENNKIKKVYFISN
ncbi:MAG: amidohydrolase family protein, partial [Ferruginibacter sp.]